MKKMLGVLLAGVMAGVLVSGLILANPGTTQAEAKTKSDKAVVLYFSGTGNTAKIAKKVKKASGESSDNLRRNAKTNKKTKWLAGKSFFNAGPSQKTISKWVKKVG